MNHYPTINLMSCIFNIHPHTITHILKRTTKALATTLKSEISWPSDEALTDLTNTFFQNQPFVDAVYVVDGSEIKISCPSVPEIQQSTWRGKKKQNSLNVMFVMKLNGKIILQSTMSWST